MILRLRFDLNHFGKPAYRKLKCIGYYNLESLRSLYLVFFDVLIHLYTDPSIYQYYVYVISIYMSILPFLVSIYSTPSLSFTTLCSCLTKALICFILIFMARSINNENEFSLGKQEKTIIIILILCL